MEFILVILIAAAVFGLCYGVDKAFAKHFRSKAQHRSGMAVRAHKSYGIFGVALSVIGIAIETSSFKIFLPDDTLSSEDGRTSKSLSYFFFLYER